MKATVYELGFSTRGEKYIGATTNYERRVYEHRVVLAEKRHHNWRVQWVYDRVGEKELTFKPVREFEARWVEEICEREVDVMREYLKEYGLELMNLSLTSYVKSFDRCGLPRYGKGNESVTVWERRFPFSPYGGDSPPSTELLKTLEDFF